jgi:hypothetical protein
MELFNEFMILAVCYCNLSFYLLSDYLELKYNIGWMPIGVVIL